MNHPDAWLGKVFKGTPAEVPAACVSDDYRDDDPRFDCFSSAVLSVAQCLAIARLVRDNPEVFATNTRKESVG